MNNSENEISTPGTCLQTQIDLPIEIVIYIMEHLPLSDRIRAGQVCRAWYEASQDLNLHKKEIVVLHNNITRPLECLLESTSNFLNFLFKEVELNSKLLPLWDKFCPQIRTLALHSCIVTERMLVDILSRCCHLESLVINNCRELMMAGRVLELASDILLLKKTLINLNELSITYNRYMSDAIFYRFTSIAPNLQVLDLSGCQISYHMGLYKKFYPSAIIDENNVILSETVFTFNVILRYIREQAEKIKVLKFGQTFIDNSALSQIARTPGLNLTAIYLPSCDQLTNTGLTDFVNLQKYITFLDVSGCSRLTDHSLIAICHNLCQLRSLSIQNCRAVTDIGIGELARLEKLQSLNLAQCEMVTGKGVSTGLCGKLNKKLEKLQLAALQLDEETVCTIAENIPFLQLLDLSWCFSAVTDRSMQAICKNLVMLNTLKLTSCDKISDVGVTGMTVSECHGNPAVEFTPAKENKFLEESYPDPLHKINLRSRAEKEIVTDAKRKNAVFQKCTYSPTAEGVCLVQIHGLQKLDISGCNRITDVGLLYAFHFPGLQFLDLSRCQQVTCVGLTALSENNPSLETLILNDCFNVTDAAVLPVVMCLKRLKHLDIQGCTLLTDASLEAIREHGLSLQYLNVSNCIAMTVAAALQVEKKLVSLHTVHYVGLKNEEFSPLGEISVPAPPPPPGKKLRFLRLR